MYWARTATSRSGHPCDTLSKLQDDFTPPKWFAQALQDARELAKDEERPKKRSKRTRVESPGGQKRRATAPISDMEDDTPATKVPAASTRRKRRTHARSTLIKEQHGDEDDDVDGETSDGDHGSDQDAPADIRPAKRARTDDVAARTVPQTQGKCACINFL